MPRRSWIVVSLAALAIAALPPRAIAAQTLGDSVGTYRFEAKSGTTILSQGFLTVTADSVTIDATPGPCKPIVNSSRSRPIAYDCGTVRIEFDRIRPLSRSYVHGSKTVTEFTRVCQIEQRNARGQIVCAKWGNESSEREVSVKAVLRIIKR